MTLKARLKAGRLVLDEATDLPEGTEVELLPLDPGAWLDEGGRAALHQALTDSDDDVKPGRLVAADVIRFFANVGRVAESPHLLHGYFGSPPDTKTVSNRMSAAQISVVYRAFERQGSDFDGGQ
jgi:hypothetical protein